MKRVLLFPLMLVVQAFALASAQAQSATPSPTPPAIRPRTVTVAPSPQTQNMPAPSATPQPSMSQPRPALPSAPQSGSSAMPALSSSNASAAPAHPLSLSKLRARLTEAQRFLKTRPKPTALMTPSLYSVTLAALDPDGSQIHLLTLPKETFLRQGAEMTLTTSLGTTVSLRILRPNYVNTAVMIFDSAGRSFAPLLVEYPIEKGGMFREMAYYTSAHPALLSPELVKAGQSYVRTMLDLAAKRLREKGKPISPAIVDIAERLCIVEHTDHDRFRKENNLQLFQEIFALYALNELDTYRYSVSSAGAGGMVQMIAWAYRLMRERHPGVGLNPDFVAGMRNHGNALEAMLLYMQDTWNDLAMNTEVAYALSAKIATQPELLAAGYNSNAARLPLYLRRGGTAWRTLIPRETQIYLQIYRSLDSLIPMKPRS